MSAARRVVSVPRGWRASATNAMTMMQSKNNQKQKTGANGGGKSNRSAPPILVRCVAHPSHVRIRPVGFYTASADAQGALTQRIVLDS